MVNVISPQNFFHQFIYWYMNFSKMYEYLKKITPETAVLKILWFSDPNNKISMFVKIFKTLPNILFSIILRYNIPGFEHLWTKNGHFHKNGKISIFL